ncbi:hypothetical protein E4T44_00462 [Aureobasidium sp. EXF-8845]|nr:hypothetical protein E4T45_12305 [Aureobasidium sp. EXF-8846]KAI4854028.1 hypothetical protein E4T44_00462 [Aureobasidium sp. EXF-8845]
MLDTLKELRSVMTLFAEVVTLTRASPALLHRSPALLETRSRPSSSWVIQGTSPVVPTLSVPQRTLEVMVRSTDRLLSSLSTASLPNLVSLVETRSVEPGCIAKSYVYADFHSPLPRTRSFCIPAPEPCC